MALGTGHRIGGGASVLDADGYQVVKLESGEVTLEAGDLEIGAVELKDATTDDRAAVSASGEVSVADATAQTSLDAIKTAVEILDNIVAGSEAQVDLVGSLPAGSAHLGTVANIHDSDSIRTGGANAVPKFAVIDHATSGDNTLVAAHATKKIRVVSAFLVASAAVNVRFESGAGGTALTGQMNLAANLGFVLPFNPTGWFETAANTLLNLELSGATSVDGCLVYIEV